MKNFIIKSIELYQKYLSPDHSFWAKDKLPYCRYTPSCSDYMKEAIEKRGIIV
jgi:putative component of membrane protein insertase Oxa1/YidC/SpoIIIJ protein YidD